MTDKPTDEDVNSPEPQENEVSQTEEHDNPDNDPMLEGLEEAEAEIAALEKEKAELEQETGVKAQEPKGNEANNGAKDDKAQSKPEDQNQNSPMIPKARFDEVLSERDLLRNQVGYMRGLIDANQQNAGKQPQKQESGNKNDQTDEDNQEGSDVDAFDAKIAEAEAKKLELAEKYDEGDLSTKQWREAEIAIDREIRGLSDRREQARLDELRQESKAHTDKSLSAAQKANYINDQALAIQQNHPNIQLIDNLPKATSDAVWATINDQAARNLAQRGVNLQDGSAQTRLALIQEKAALTDQLTPENTTALLMGQYQFVDPRQYQAPTQQAQGQTAQKTEGVNKQTSPEAKNRGEKLELANSQPPSIAGMGKGTGTGELTEADIENMSQEQLADLMQKSPQLVQRAVGFQQ